MLFALEISVILVLYAIQKAVRLVFFLNPYYINLLFLADIA